jgi:hypothetical protein
VSQFEVAGTCAGRGQAKPLAKGETCTVVVGFKPTSTGPKSVTPTTVTNGPAFTTGAITGFGRRLTAVAAQDFGDRHVGTSVKRTLRITNDGAEDYPLGAVAVPSQYVKGADGCGGRTLAAGASCEVEVSFAPTTGGAKTGFVTIAGHKPNLIALSGAGTEAVAALAPAAADLTAGPQTFSVRNTGNEALEVLTAKVGAGFAIGADACSRRTVAPGAACTLTVTRIGDAGWITSEVEVGAANLAGSPVVARVSGRLGAGTDTRAAPSSTGPTPTAATRSRRPSPARSAGSSRRPTSHRTPRSRSSAATAATTRPGSTRRTDAYNVHTGVRPRYASRVQGRSAGAAAALGGDDVGELGVDLGGHGSELARGR